MEIIRKYNAATKVLFPLIDRGGVDFESTPVTFVDADTKISKDEGTFEETDAKPSHEGNGMYSLALTADEMSAARIMITCIDSPTKTWVDQAILVATYGHASAQHDFVDDLLEAPMSGHVEPGTLGGAINALVHHESSGTAQSAGGNAITLDSSANNASAYYTGMFVVILSATAGAGQVRQILGYFGTTRVAILANDWLINPTGTVKYAIMSFASLVTSDVRRWMTDEPLDLSSGKVEAVT